MHSVVNTLLNTLVNTLVHALVNALVNALVDTLVNAPVNRASCHWSMASPGESHPPSPQPPYHSKSGLIGI